jgi:hypothetical protein
LCHGDDTTVACAGDSLVNSCAVGSLKPAEEAISSLVA